MDTSDTRALVVRVPAETKRNFKIALLRHHLTIQGAFAAFMDVFSAQCDKPSGAIKIIITRAVTLQRKEG
jgi:hypothetical protein